VSARPSGLPFVTKQESSLALLVLESKLGVESPNTVAVIRGRIHYLEDLLERIYRHAYDDDTPGEDLRADIDSMRDLAFEGWEGDGE